MWNIPHNWIIRTTALSQKVADYILSGEKSVPFELKFLKDLNKSTSEKKESKQPEKTEAKPEPKPKAPVKPITPRAPKKTTKTVSQPKSNIEVELVRNEKIKRLQLKFTRKPSEVDRAILKDNGFSWAPKQKVWQIPISSGNEEKVKQAVAQMSCILKKKSEGKSSGKVRGNTPKTPKRATKKPTGSKKANVQMMNLSIITTDEKRFQNRQNAFSEESANRIVKAYEEGKFNWAAFDPIVVWREKSTHLYKVLSGHSRFAAFKKLSKKDAQFQQIPVKIFAGTEAEAIDFALNSNTLSTKETDLERAAYYQNKRINCGLSGPSCARQIEEEIREKEGKNASTIHNLSYLNPKGWIVQQILQFDGKDKTSSNNLNTIATWTGEARRKFPKLTDQHENQIAKWLLEKGFGNRSGQFSAKSKFFQYLDRFSDMGKFDAVINLDRQVSKSPAEQEWEEQKRELEKVLKAAEKEYQEKSTRFYAAVNSDDPTRKISKAKADELSKPYLDKVGTIKQKLAKHQMKKAEAKQAGRKQTALFGTKKKAS
ncbi:hypothetical protein [Persicobacter diffluens]|uniref:ParB/Sulfiredoxin domain-containing protein n=1 Tax=Persicobacter diffluens TaxID=981 RepID=A0AAN4W355_9BACT|nr:hypothetical protein PEDI_54110 [Persicobacter diffluens]